MNCRWMKTAGGATVIVCGNLRQKLRRCIVCNRAENQVRIKLCDYPTDPTNASKTCDRIVCIDHAYHVPPDEDYCPEHVTFKPEEA